MNFFNTLKEQIKVLLNDMVAAGDLPKGLDYSRVTVELPRDPSHGDLATNAAMLLAKGAGKKPRDIAQLLAVRLLDLDDVTAAEVAGPGFINMRLRDSFWHARLADVLGDGLAYGNSTMGKGEKINVEYVSANPTGPMHVGHARGAVVGDALACLLQKAGYDVTKEYYVNDAGTQIDVLTRSLHLRYREALGENIGEIPEGLYPGDYLKPAGKALADRDGDKWRDADEADWLPALRQFAIDQMMDLIREDLAMLGVRHDVFSSERTLVDAGGVDAVVTFLEERDLIYTGVLPPPKGRQPDDWEARPQTLFRATNFGDDVDRALRKSDGTWTYFAADMAYHLDKFRRGYATMIDIWGADHGGYVKRVASAVKALSEGEGELDVKLCQMVNLMEDGKPFKMSKRAGTFVTLRDMIDKVGKDVVRFIMLFRKNDAQLDFDFTKVVEKSKDNPVFYVQYAHARAHSVMRHAVDQSPDISLELTDLVNASLDRLTDPAELAVIKTMAAFPRMVENAAETHEPHRLAFYLYDLASMFHVLWNQGKDNASLRFLIEEDADLTRARLALVKGLATVIASGLDVFGVEPVKEMR